jgi:hypothetical protein
VCIADFVLQPFKRLTPLKTTTENDSHRWKHHPLLKTTPSAEINKGASENNSWIADSQRWKRLPPLTPNVENDSHH